MKKAYISMKTSYFENMLHSVRPFIAENLIPADYMNRIGAFIKCLPESFGLSDFGFEIPMCRDEYGADFMVSSNKRCNGPGFFMKYLMQKNQYDSVLGRFMLFWHAMEKGTYKINAFIDDICFEYDLMKNPDINPNPCVFFYPASSEEKYRLPLLSNDVVSLISEFEDAIQEECVSYSAKMSLLKVLGVVKSQFGPHKKVMIGVMIARGTDSVRLVININKKSDMMVFLSEIGWPGDIDNLSTLLDSWDRIADNINMNIDIGKEVSDRIGFELYCSKPSQKVVEEFKWKKLFDYCVLNRLCDEQKILSLSNYSGYKIFNDIANHSSDVGSDCPLLYSLSQITLIRRLYHMKIILDSVAGLKCKSYIGVKPHFQPSLFCR